MFEFLGALMGMALRSGVLVYVNLAPYVWKMLTEEALTEEDLAYHDVKEV
jgi:hypothetical protein